MSDRESFLTNLKAEQLLKILHPELLFSGNLDALRGEYKGLVNRWHPDRKTGNPEVMVQINALYQEAEERIARGDWQGRGTSEIHDTRGRLHRFVYLRRVPFELGEVFLGRSFVAYVVNEENADFGRRALTVIPSFSYADDSMRGEMQPSLPWLRDHFLTSDGQTVLVLEKAPEALRLRDLLDHVAIFGGVPDWPRHVAWILNSLYNLCCYLAYAGLCHLDLSPDSYFISPSSHTGALLGGWWYCEAQGQKLRGVTARTYEQLPPDLLDARRADVRIDLELVRATGRELLGDPKGMRLLTSNVAPAPLVTWLRSSSGGDPFEDYRNFQDCLRASFGRRKFVPLHVTSEEIYR